MTLSEKQIADNDLISGTVSLKGDVLIYTSQGKELCQVNIDSVKAIGEMTTQADPINTDWFMVFVNHSNECIYISTYANGMEEALKGISQILGSSLVAKLFASVKFDSNILFPSSLEGKKLFTFKDVPPQNIFEKIGKFLGLGKPISPSLTEEIINFK